MKTFEAVLEWMEGSAAAFLDPAMPVCQLFFRWVDDLAACRGDELICGLQGNDVAIILHPLHAGIALPVQSGEAEFNEEHGSVEKFGAVKIAPGLWALAPSVNIPGVIHAFVVLYGVPEPAPWERLIVMPGERKLVLP
jgi:hypothetical protein